MLTTGWTIEKEDDYTFKIKDRGRLSNTVRKSDIANFGQVAENYSLWKSTPKRPQQPRQVEQRRTRSTSTPMRCTAKKEDSKKIHKRAAADNPSGISSIGSKVSGVIGFPIPVETALPIPVIALKTLKTLQVFLHNFHKIPPTGERSFLSALIRKVSFKLIGIYSVSAPTSVFLTTAR